MSYSHHCECFKLPRKLVAGVSIAEFVDDYLLVDDGGGVEEGDGPLLTPDRKAEVIGLLEQAAVAKKKGGSSNKRKSKQGDGDDDGEDKIFIRVQAAAKAAAENDDNKKSPSKKKVKTEKGPVAAKDEIQAMVPIYNKYHKHKVDQLKDILRWNNQLLKGNKDFVLFKVMDGAVHGRLGFCPLCQGALKWNEDDLETVHCGGRYDEDLSAVQLCSYTAPRAGKKAAARLLPFYMEEPVRIHIALVARCLFQRLQVLIFHVACYSQKKRKRR